ncbi:uncharacterized protein LOC131802039 [Musca domestica]|uniref:Uncharacterized protein LOC131802039 n=1 Tax=Musca domestica TaxID=7370 RepID=A0ABM3UV11_MUSDO|nr:uncharacterized protein LOC131802039 [Musca domestica]
MHLYKDIRRKYNTTTINKIKQYSKCNRQTASLSASVTFLIKCRNIGIIPNFIHNTTKNTYNMFKANDKIPPNLLASLKTHNYNFHLKLLKLLIQHKHKELHKNKITVTKTKETLQQVMDENDFSLLMESENHLHKTHNNNNKTRHVRKYEALLQKQREKLNIKHNNEWFSNNTSTVIPEDIQWLLSLGPKYALPTTKASFPLLNVIAESEECVQTLINKEDQENGRIKLVSLIDDHLQRTKLSIRDKIIIDTVGRTKQFLKQNKDILILNADKGGKTVAMYKNEYDTKMKNILRDMCIYRRLKRDPTYNLQNKNNKLTEKLLKMNIINVFEKNKLSTNTAVAPRIYGLPKIHKEGNPLRPICSSINSPTYELSKYIVDILKHLTKDSSYNIKDALDLKDRIKEHTYTFSFEDNNRKMGHY